MRECSGGTELGHWWMTQALPPQVLYKIYYVCLLQVQGQERALTMKGSDWTWASLNSRRRVFKKNGETGSQVMTACIILKSHPCFRHLTQKEKHERKKIYYTPKQYIFCIGKERGRRTPRSLEKPTEIVHFWLPEIQMGQDLGICFSAFTVVQEIPRG